MNIDHLDFAVSDYERGKRFHTAALAALGIQLVMDVGGAAGFGAGGMPGFWFATGARLDAEALCHEPG